MEQLVVFRGVDIEGGDRLVVIGRDTIDAAHQGEALLNVAAIVFQHAIGARQGQTVDLDVVVGLEGNGKIAVLRRTKTYHRTLDRRFRLDQVGHHFDLPIKQAHGAVGVFDLRGEFQGFVMAD